MSGDRRPRWTLRVEALARVEGEGALHIRVRGGRVESVRLEIYEPPRFFEAFLRGRDFREAPDITARICGICPVAYQMSAVQAMERLCGVTVPPPLRDLRHLLYCAEWVESHALHIFLLHAPDFLGYEDALRMARDHPEPVRRGLELKKTGNDLLAFLGGREVHPINVRVGGFYRVPTRREMDPWRERLERALEGARWAVRWAAGLPFPDFEQDFTFLALSHPEEYAILEGEVATTAGPRFPVSAFEEWVEEEQVPHSNALHARLRGVGAYLAGPLARFHLNFDRLSPGARSLAREVGVVPPVRNPFQSIVVRCLEVVHALETALTLVEGYREPETPAVPVEPRPGVGHGATEAPRGLLYHRYRVAEDGTILSARIVPPTAQNQARIEEDLRAFVSRHLDLPRDRLTWACEQVIRNYDPCISCATHFLTLHWEEG